MKTLVILLIFFFITSCKYDKDSSKPIIETNNVPQYIISALDSGARWGKDSLTFSIPVEGSTWSFLETNPNFSYSFFNPQQAEQFRKVIRLWDDVISLDFIEVIEPDNVGDIRIAFSHAEGLSGWTNGRDIWIDDANKSSNFLEETSSFSLIMHEMGHVMKLRHPYTSIEYESNATVFYTADDTNYHLPENEIYNQHTVMKWVFPLPYIGLEFYVANDKLGVNTKYITPKTLMLYDIAVAQQIYGAEMNTRTEDNIYKWDDNEQFYMTIWDAGGNDTIDASNQTKRNIINLGSGEFSSIAYQTLDEFTNEAINNSPDREEDIKKIINTYTENFYTGLYTGEKNLAVAYGVVIENAIGGKNNDNITGNKLNNKLTGNEGNDYINGKEGFDTAVYKGNYNQYDINILKNGSKISITDLISNEGKDTL